MAAEWTAQRPPPEPLPIRGSHPQCRRPVHRDPVDDRPCCERTMKTGLREPRNAAPRQSEREAERKRFDLKEQQRFFSIVHDRSVVSVEDRIGRTIAIIARTARAKPAHHSFDSLAGSFLPPARVKSGPSLDVRPGCCAHADGVTAAAPANCRNSHRRNNLLTRGLPFEIFRGRFHLFVNEVKA